MLSDEMTTGSVTSTDVEKRDFALRSHEWNRKQKRFRDAFPEVSGQRSRNVYVLTNVYL
jgi:ubiquitin-conjugating enzyme E2 J2